MDSLKTHDKEFRFDRTRRLCDKKDYEVVFKQANKTTTAEFIVLHRKSTFETARLGLAISKKVLPKAHQRNRVKRILRESFRKSALPSVDIVFLAKHGVVNKDNNVLFEKLSVLWDKLAASYLE